MPPFDSLSLARTLRAQHVATPIVLLSSDATVAPFALTAGADCFVLKHPAILHELEQALLALLPAEGEERHNPDFAALFCLSL